MSWPSGKFLLEAPSHFTQRTPHNESCSEHHELTVSIRSVVTGNKSTSHLCDPRRLARKVFVATYGRYHPPASTSGRWSMRSALIAANFATLRLHLNAYVFRLHATHGVVERHAKYFGLLLIILWPMSRIRAALEGRRVPTNHDIVTASIKDAPAKQAASNVG